MSKLFRSLVTSYGALRQGGKVALFAMLATPAAAEETTILALGDSLTAGYGLFDAEGLVPQLHDWLEARGNDVRIINAGVSGDTTAGGLARVEWSLTPQVDAMIVALGGNDFLRGIDPDVSRANLDGIMQIARGADLEVLLVGIVASGNYGAEYQQQFNGMYPALADSYGTLLARDFFNGFRASVDAGAEVSDFMQRDGIHPNAAGVTLIVEDLGPQVEALIDRANRE
ncbi:arylesterase [Rhodobacteraceae bacterium N5(2021)]|uniref:Arylesterase n=1 Tax=Gymnodinialimonas phycosphaerae TaxID=2841589 RepID=A0A975TRY3_9RHOB|nr:arylesterase [Gymnodinialimonas phycosphaerae]MBY4893467.1 arylesterase [Gymnodinialimonas phycosphaerae]